MNNELKKRGCVFIPSFLDDETTKFISSYIQNKAKRESFVPEGLDWVSSKYFWYADPLTETVLENSILKVEGITEKSLYPTYSFSRIYSQNDLLIKHIDRDECEYSVSIHIGKEGEDSPFYIKNNFGKIEEHVFNPGDAIVYFGNKCLHWRKPLVETRTLANAQVMLHYVDKNGEYSDLRLDGRKELGLSLSKVNWV